MRNLSIITSLISSILMAMAFTKNEHSNTGMETFTDPRDNKVYTLVKFGNQTWFAENLNYVVENSWCYNNDSQNCNLYGRLYNWEAALTACPSGWHLPTQTEWENMMVLIGWNNDLGGNMKSKHYWQSPNTGATNISGFSALPGGTRNQKGKYDALGTFGLWWSSTLRNYNTASAYMMTSFTKSVGNPSYDKDYALSCRCVKD